MCPTCLVAHPSRPYKTVKEMIKYGKKHPNEITYGSPGSGASPAYRARCSRA